MQKRMTSDGHMMVPMNKIPKGHSKDIVDVANAIRSSYKDKPGKARDYSKAVKKYSKELKSPGEK
jgi:hypothetical protein